MRWWRRRRSGTPSEADQALADAQAAERHVEQTRQRIEPVLDRIQQHLADNAIYEAFTATLRSTR